MTDIEKKWLALAILFALLDIHCGIRQSPVSTFLFFMATCFALAMFGWAS